MVGERLGRGVRAVALGEWFVGVAIIAVGLDFLGSCWSLCIGFWLFFWNAFVCLALYEIPHSDFVDTM